MGRWKNISDFYGRKLTPEEDDYSADSFPDRKWRKNEDIALIIDDDSRKNGEVRIIKEGRK